MNTSPLTTAPCSLVASPLAHEFRLEMFEIRKAFGATQALDGVSLAVRPGEVHALIGENGAGKSTLMKTLSGAITADSGSMKLDGVSYSPRRPSQAREQGVSMIYQELSIVPHLSVLENILLGCEKTIGGVVLNYPGMAKIAREALAQLDHADLPLHQLAGNLSVAEQQIVEIARSIAVGCRILVFDEPTSSLTQADVKRLFALIERLKKQNIAIVYISHFLEEVREISDTFTVLRDGKSVGSGITKDVSNQEIIAMMVGRQVDRLYPRSPRTPGEILLEVKHVAGTSKPSDASLTLRRGEVLGIAGLVGAGRTEFLRTLFGLDAVKNGEIKVGGYSGHGSPRKRWSQGVGYVSEDRKVEGLAITRSIAENITLSKLNGLGPFGTVFPKTQQIAAQKWINQLQIKCRQPSQEVGGLSGGNQQKVAVARLLHHDVDVLLLDEPTRGIDVGAKATIYEWIDALASGKIDGRARAIIIISSYLPELMGICDRIAVMCRGKLERSYAVCDVTEHQLMLDATGTEGALQE